MKYVWICPVSQKICDSLVWPCRSRDSSSDICQNNTCITVHPLFSFGVSRLCEGSLYVGRTRCKVKIPFTVFPLRRFLLVALTPHLKKSIPLMLTVPFLKQKRHLEAFQLPSLSFWLVVQSARAPLVFRQQVVMNSHVTKQLFATVPVTLLQFRPSESLFASLLS